MLANTYSLNLCAFSCIAEAPVFERRNKKYYSALDGSFVEGSSFLVLVERR